ncbi:MAG: hypothetical protein K6T26_00785 [Alicyclobacillus sp.]|nr:hypothetical protein [Alicyclobacillus sp.]
MATGKSGGVSMTMERVATGVAGLDSALGGGLPACSAVLVEGCPGTGKSLLGLEYIYRGAVELHEPGVYITFEELPEQLYDLAAGFAWDVRAAEAAGMLRVVCTTPRALVEALCSEGSWLAELLRLLGCKRLVLDNLTPLKALAAEPGAQRELLYSVRGALRRHGLTALLIREDEGPLSVGRAPEHYVFDGIIRLTWRRLPGCYRERRLEIWKMRGTRAEPQSHVLRIGHKGLHVLHTAGPGEEAAGWAGTTPEHLGDLVQEAFPAGTLVLLDADACAPARRVLTGAARLHAGEREVRLLLGMSEGLSASDWLAALPQLPQLVRERRAWLVEPLNRPAPPVLHAGWLALKGGQRQFRRFVRRRGTALVLRGLREGGRWFVGFSLHPFYPGRRAGLGTGLVEALAGLRSIGVSAWVHANVRELGEPAGQQLWRMCDGVLRLWTERGYTYVQVRKSPVGMLSPPYILQWETAGGRAVLR